jgi:AcrR family transcriptional regulator
MKSNEPRKYNMSVRGKTAAMTETNILKAIGELWLSFNIHEITLEMIALKAGVNERTILRKFGSKEGLLEAALKADDAAGIKSIKDEAEAGNIEQIVQTLIKEYKISGQASIRTLAIEHEIPIAAEILSKGRQMHRDWCERVFRPYLPSKKNKYYYLLIGAFYAATDVHNWKLLSQDLGYSQKDTAEILSMLLRSIINSINK